VADAERAQPCGRPSGWMLLKIELSYSVSLIFCTASRRDAEQTVMSDEPGTRQFVSRMQIEPSASVADFLRRIRKVNF
jgi:hypothetical protein